MRTVFYAGAIIVDVSLKAGVTRKVIVDTGALEHTIAALLQTDLPLRSLFWTNTFANLATVVLYVRPVAYERHLNCYHLKIVDPVELAWDNDLPSSIDAPPQPPEFSRNSGHAIRKIVGLRELRLYG